MLLQQDRTTSSLARTLSLVGARALFAQERLLSIAASTKLLHGHSTKLLHGPPIKGIMHFYDPPKTPQN